MYIDEAGLMRYGPETPAEDLGDEVFLSVTAVEGLENGLIPESMRTPEDNFRIRLAANLLIDGMLEYAAQHGIKPKADDMNMPGVL